MAARSRTSSQQPQLNVVTQYIKDFSFENPNAPNSLAAGKKPPKISIQINVNASPLTETDIEVTLGLEGKAEVAEHCCSASSWYSPACSASKTCRRKA